MAEHIIKIGDSPNPKGFRDGDMMHSLNDVYLLWQATQRITDHRKEKTGFFKPLNCMACRRLEAVSKYRFERVGKHVMKRITLSDMSEEILTGPEFNVTVRGVSEFVSYPTLLASSWKQKNLAIRALFVVASKYGTVVWQDTDLFINEMQTDYTVDLVAPDVMHLEEYVARRKAGGKLPMFGREDAVVWFGGRTDVNLTVLSALWTDVITPETGLLESDHKKPTKAYPTHFLKKHLVVVTTDFDNVRRGILESPDIEEIPDPDNRDETITITHAKRKHRVDWRNMTGMSAGTIGDIEDGTIRVEVKRDLVRVETDLVEVKTR